VRRFPLRLVAACGNRGDAATVPQQAQSSERIRDGEGERPALFRRQGFGQHEVAVDDVGEGER